MTVYWEHKLDDFGRKLVRFCGADPDNLPSDHNPITRELREGDLITHLEYDAPWFQKRSCRVAMSRAATICQMKVYDAQGGPDGDGEPKGGRRSWYAWFKVDFAQRMSRYLGEKEFNGTLWNGRQSQVYGKMVDTMDVTYQDLWVKDSSRMMKSFYDELYRGSNIVLVVEKDSLMDDFAAAARALGCKVLLSGKGKMSKAGTEKMLRDHFHWNDYEVFSEEEPLVYIHLSDWDYDGEHVIGPTFSEQATRYTGHVLNERIGINPFQVDAYEWPYKWFDLKLTNTAYIKWALGEGLYQVECSGCGNTKNVYRAADLDAGELHRCERCGTSLSLAVKDESKLGYAFLADPHGFEVEALPTRAYYPLAVEALLRAIPFDHILDKLRDECMADTWQASRTIMEQICSENEDFQDLLAEFDRLNEIKSAFERRASGLLETMGLPHRGDWRDLEDDPKADDFKHYVEVADRGSSPWRPFDQGLRTQRLVNRLLGAGQGEVSRMVAEDIDWRLEQ